MKLNKSIKKTFSILLEAAKISAACAIAIGISALLGLKYSITAGLIAVLSIQSTKKETAAVALKRLMAFAAAVIISFVDFKFLGYNTYSFTLYLFAFIILCQFFGLQSAIVPVSVLITHIVTEKQFTVSMVVNEFFLLFIGAGVGFLANIYLRKNIRLINNQKEQLDSEIKNILQRMADRVLIPDKTGYDGKCFDKINSLLTAAKATAVTNLNNSFDSSGKYDLMYLEMREEQCAILYEMYKDVREINATPEQVHTISDFLRKISLEYYEQNDVKDLYKEINGILLEMKEEKMPETRLEFENRALLFSLLIKIREFLSIKYIFIKSGRNQVSG